MPQSFTPGTALLGGALIGLSASGVLLLLGRIAGISGIFSGALLNPKADGGWRAPFVFGLLTGGVALRFCYPAALDFTIHTPLPLLLTAGLLVGVGTRMGRGCTSGHGVCGIARLSARGIAATAVFMGSAFLTVYLTRHVGLR